MQSKTVNSTMIIRENNSDSKLNTLAISIVVERL